MNTFTAQELADFYQKVADGGEIQTYLRESLDSDPEWVDSVYGPRPNCLEPRYWRIKPTQKVIDLSVLIGSRIDCEFTDNCWQAHSYIDILTDIECNAVHPYTTDDVDISYNKCRPRMNHIHAWQGDECPLPEGFMVKVWYRNGISSMCNHIKDHNKATNLRWSTCASFKEEIIAFEVLGLADGYVMPWEQDND